VPLVALVKRGNRKGELLLREVEYAATVASLREPQYSYPKKVRELAQVDFVTISLTTSKYRNSTKLGKSYFSASSTTVYLAG